MDHQSISVADVDRRTSLVYRPDIDGLRAVAILSVFVFHLDSEWLPGGFIGVDIFFVISGYLITGVLLADLCNNRFNLTRFYQRRIARLFPMMITVVLATMGAASLIYSPQDYASAGVNSAASLLSVANLKYLLQGSYFAVSPDAQPFLHFWSLSVEEQFYIIFPALLFFLFRFVPHRLATVVASLSFLSLGACIVVTLIYPAVAFYILPTRAWELGIGSLLAICGTQLLGALPKGVRPFLAIAGIAAILLACVTFRETMAFPGYAAILPVVGAAAILLASLQPGYVGYAFLSAPPVVLVGLASYALYLWHWPVFSITDYAFFTSPGWVRLFLKISLSIVLTALTYQLLERPSKRFLSAPSRRWATIGIFVLVAAAWTPIGISIRKDFYIDASPADVADGGLFYPGDHHMPTVILLGDSNGSMYARTLLQICFELGWSLRVASVAAGDALPRLDSQPSELWRNSLALVERVQPDIVVIAEAWMDKLTPDRDKLTLALDALRPYTGRIILLNQPPILPQNASRESIRSGTHSRFRDDVKVQEARTVSNAFLKRFESDKVIVVDISSAFVDGSGNVLFTDESGKQLYHDAGHLSGYGTARIRNRLEAALREK